MKKKILTLILGVFVVIFFLTVFAQIFATTQPQEAVAAPDEHCYWLCVDWCGPCEADCDPGCFGGGDCERWEWVCPGDPRPPVK